MSLHADDVKTVLDLALGRITLAELEGMTAEQAQEIAQTACELAEAGRLNEARTLFEGLTAVNPLDAAAHAALGTVQLKLGLAGDALASFDRALALVPEHPVALMGRGELRLQRGDRGGLEDVARAFQSDPEGRTSAGRRAQGLMKVLVLGAVKA